MPNTRQLRLQWLATQFEALADDLNKSNDSQQRKEFLRRMKVILNEVDELILLEHPTVDSKHNAILPQEPNARA
jgi:hypothetical protein